MKIIDVPETITVEFIGSTGQEKEEIPFKRFLIHHLDQYPETLKTITQVTQAQKIVDAINAGNGSISLEDADYEVLKAACQTPRYLVARQLLAYYAKVNSPQEVAASKADMK